MQNAAHPARYAVRSRHDAWSPLQGMVLACLEFLSSSSKTCLAECLGMAHGFSYSLSAEPPNTSCARPNPRLWSGLLFTWKGKVQHTTIRRHKDKQLMSEIVRSEAASRESKCKSRHSSPRQICGQMIWKERTEP